MSIYSSRDAKPARRGIALISVLFFLVVCALAITAVFFAHRSAKHNSLGIAAGARLLAAADASLHASLSRWSSIDRNAQVIGSTVATTVAEDGRIRTTTYVTRLAARIFSITSEAQLVGSSVARRVSLLVRLPFDGSQLHGALVSAVGTTIGSKVRFVRDSASCDTGAAVRLAPTVALSLDAGIPPDSQPSILRDAIAEDSSLYLRVGDRWWSELAQRADIRLAGDTRVTPAPIVDGAQCGGGDTNWGDPLGAIAACVTRAPLVYVSGDLTIDGGVGQGVLLVDGHLAIAGPFTFSGQIVARRGIETLADNIAISGALYAWRASTDASVSHAITNDVRLTHAMTLRSFGCDGRHGVASWLQPRPVRERAWSELF